MLAERTTRFTPTWTHVRAVFPSRIEALVVTLSVMRHALLLALVTVSACRGADPAPAGPPATPDPAEAAEPSEPPAAAVETPDDGVHGRLTEVKGQRVLHVWGTPQEMGYAHGALLRDSIVSVLEDYALEVIPPSTLDTAGAIYGAVADIPAPLREEAAAIVEGMRDHGGAEVPSLGRELTTNDLLVVNAMTDLLAIGCSSLSAWGDATDGALGDEARIVRNLDWSEDAALLENQILIAYEPSDPEQQKVLSVAFAGYIGCLSCMNEAGVSALFNMGYGDGAASIGEAMKGFAPSNLMLRDVLGRRDVDGDGKSTADDVEAAVRKQTHAGSWILHVLEPNAAAKERERAPARILEVESDGVHTRIPQAKGVGPSMLAATNHLRGKDGPEACWRYDRIERTAKAQESFEREAMWDLAVEVRLEQVVHTMALEPGSRRLALWLRQPGEAHRSTRAPVVHEWDDVFSR